MKNTMEILTQYTEGKLALTEANAQLGATDSGLYIDPERNTITAAERAQTTTGEAPADANGFGLLDIGVGTPDKVRVANGVLVGTDCGELCALCVIGGKTYHVQGAALTD